MTSLTAVSNLQQLDRRWPLTIIDTKLLCEDRNQSVDGVGRRHSNRFRQLLAVVVDVKPQPGLVHAWSRVLGVDMEYSRKLCKQRNVRHISSGLQLGHRI